MPITPHDLDQAVNDARLRLHARVWPVSLGVTAAMATALAFSVLDHLSTALWVGWLSLLGVSLVLRAVVGRQHRQALARGDPAALAPHWLRRYRLAFALHGAAWCTASLLWPPLLPHEAFDVLLFALSGVTAGALIATAFDLRAAALFAAPALAPIIGHLLLRPESSALALGLMVLLFVAVAVASTQRLEAFMREAIGLRLTQADERDKAQAAQRALADRNRLIDDLLTSTEQGFWFVDNEGVTLNLNPAMCRLLGRPMEAVMGQQACSFFEGEDRATLLAALAARRAGQPRGHYEVAIRRPDGTHSWCMNQYTTVHDAQGARVGSVGVWTDITARRQMEQALRDFERITNAMPDAVSLVGADRAYRIVNDAWCRTMRLSREQVLGRKIESVFDSKADSAREQALQRCLEHHTVEVVIGRASFIDEREVLLETTYAPYPRGPDGESWAVLITRDVTAREQDRRQLLSTSAYLHRTLEATGDAIFAADDDALDAPVAFANAQMLQLWGIRLQPGQALTSRVIMDHALPLFDDAEAELRRIRAIIAADARDESHLHLRDGRVLLRHCEPARLADRTLRVWSFRDVTAETRAMQVVQRAEAEMRALMQAFPGHLARLDERLVYTYVNASLAARLGRAPELIIGHGVQEVLGEERAARFEVLARRVLAGQTVSYEHRHRPQPGLPAAVSMITLIPGLDPRSGRPAVFGFGIDITERKQAEAALIAARDEAQRANQAKSVFMSQMSHELRTPLNAILGFGQLLELDDRRPLADAQRGWVREIRRGAEHLLVLINDILDLGRIEAGHLLLELRAVPLGALADELMALVRPLADQHQVQLDAPQGPWAGTQVLADATRLRQVLLNLLGNAIKYNRRGGRVLMRCRVQDGQLWIGVEDTGPGLTAEQRARLFQPFERLDAGHSGVEGTGIGLALCRRLVQAMGGQIGVDSEPGAGSTFWLSLPLAGRDAAPAPGRVAYASAPPAMPRAPVTPAPTAAQGAPQRVLYIEDNAVNVALMRAMLARLPGVELSVAMHPIDGLRLAAELRPALVLLDIQLPEIDGFEVLARLRAEDATHDVPVVAVSANALPADVAAAMAAGFSAYLTKPLDIDLLLATVARALQLPVPVEADGGR